MNLKLKLSIILNLVFVMIFLFAGYKLKEEIYIKITSYGTYDIVMFGNSLTAEGKWNKNLKRLFIKNSGRGGFTTSHFVWILKGDVLKYNPKICFIEGGINDIGVGIPLKRIFQNYESIIDTLIKYNVEPILQSTFYVNSLNDSVTNSKVDSLNIYLSNLANVKGLLYLDINQHISENGRLKNDLTHDGIHLNNKGYKIWSREIEKILKLKGL